MDFVWCMDEEQEFQKLVADPELVVSVEFRGGFYQAFIGDQRYGYRAWSRTGSFAAAVKWLQEAAVTLCPQSRYARELHG